MTLSRIINARPAAAGHAAPSGLRTALRPLFAALSLLAALACCTGSAEADSRRLDAEYFTNLPVTTHEGKTVPFYDALIKGKIVVFTFIYLNCNDICPLTTSRIAEIKDRLGDAVGRDIFIYSMTMDPERDTPEMLKLHADAFEAGKGWTFLTGKPEDIKLLRWRLGERSRKLTEHRNDMMLGNDITGEWSRSSIYSDLDVAVSTIRSLDPEWRAKKRTVLGQSGFDPEKHSLTQQTGQALFVKACSTCHSIGGGDLVGPDLKDISTKRDRDWLERFLLSPNGMRAAKDPIALANAKKYMGVKMPNLGLSTNDIDDLMVYIESKSRARDAQAAPHPAQPGG
jgi:protein SCO1/2